MREPLSYEVRDGIAWLTIDRPGARNALSAAVREALWDGAHRFNGEAAARFWPSRAPG